MATYLRFNKSDSDVLVDALSRGLAFAGRAFRGRDDLLMIAAAALRVAELERPVRVGAPFGHHLPPEHRDGRADTDRDDLDAALAEALRLTRLGNFRQIHGDAVEAIVYRGADGPAFIPIGGKAAAEGRRP